MYAVAGVSGNTGAVVADELLKRKLPVRVIVRGEAKGEAWRAKGAEVAVASLDDAGALTEALRGLDGVYLLLPPDMQTGDFFGRARAFGEAFATAIRAAGVKNVVFLSSIGAQHERGTGPIAGLHIIEEALRKSGANLTFLRPTYFIENWGSVVGAAQAQGVLPTFLTPSLCIPMVATDDIGRVAADALANPANGVRVIEIAGPADYTSDEIASELGSVLGKPVHVAAAPLEAVVPTFTQLGISEHVANVFREMYEGLNSGHVAWDGSGERRRGTTTPADVFRQMTANG